jgi:hypothetical protein
LIVVIYHGSSLFCYILDGYGFGLNQTLTVVDEVGGNKVSDPVYVSSIYCITIVVIFGFGRLAGPWELSFTK